MSTTEAPTLTALALTDQQWKDLAYIARVFFTATENMKRLKPDQLRDTIRRRALAEQIMEME